MPLQSLMPVLMLQELKSQAILHGDKYILNGHKRFITNGSVFSFITVLP